MPYVTPDRREFLEPALAALASILKPTVEHLEGAIEVLLTTLSPTMDRTDSLTQDSTWKDEPWYDVATLAADRLLEIADPKVGDKNYFISELILRVWFERVGYSTINTVVGVLSALRASHAPIVSPFDVGLVECLGVLRCLEHELLRRVHDPYEDDQISASGDIFEPRLGSRYIAPNHPLHRLGL